MPNTYLNYPKPLVIAHRGGSEFGPENSWDALTGCVRAGLTHIETDVHTTSDGVAVLLHDPHVQRVTNGHGPLAKMTWQQARKLRDHNGNPLVRLDEALQTFPDTRWNLDAKAWPSVNAIAQCLRRIGGRQRVCIASFSDLRLRRIRTLLGPLVTTSYGPAGIARLTAAAATNNDVAQKTILAALPDKNAGLGCVQVPVNAGPIRIITPKFIELCHNRGLDVHAWTINDPTQAAQLVEMGVDGIVTDIPATIADKLRTKGTNFR